MPDRPGFDFAGDYAARYERVIRRVVPGYDDLTLLAHAALRMTVGPRARVLIVGAGTGNELAAYATAEPGWRFTAVEPSGAMISQAKARMSRLGLEERVDFVQVPLAELPETEPFDAASLLLVLHFQADNGAKRDLLREIARRLGPGGALVMVDAYGAKDAPGFARLMDAWMRYARSHGVTEAEEWQYRQQVEDGVHFVPEERVIELLSEAGFRNPSQFYRALVFGGWAVERT
jgi:tRNA (cmo5U34)-methyltransferase